jgi:hypothetical protein
MASKCKTCGNEIGKKQTKYCSLECSWKSSDRVRNHPTKFSQKEKDKIKDVYTNPDRKSGFLISLANDLNRPKTNISRYARSMGWTDKNTKGMTELQLSAMRNKVYTDEDRKKISDRSKKWHKENEHPRGFLGKKHTQKTKDIVRDTHLGVKQPNEAVWSMLKTKEKKGNLYPKRPHGSWKAGWETIGDRRIYFRSTWEKEYAHYLEFMVRTKQIKSWDFECKTFWFEKIKRGTRSYLPDFQITNLDGSIEYHEVKGWMDAKSKTKLKRMRKYYPEVVVKLIQKKELKELGII